MDELLSEEDNVPNPSLMVQALAPKIVMLSLAGNTDARVRETLT